MISSEQIKFKSAFKQFKPGKMKEKFLADFVYITIRSEKDIKVRVRAIFPNENKEKKM